MQKLLAWVGGVTLLSLLLPLLGPVVSWTLGLTANVVDWAVEHRPVITFRVSATPTPTPPPPPPPQKRERWKKEKRVVREPAPAPPPTTVPSCDTLPFDRMVECRQKRFGNSNP